ncbi:MAG: copper chaperone PCu(A)C [Burkholderiales bacterium]
MVASGGVLSQVQVHDPWVRATVATQKSSGAYMHLASKDDARLVSVSSTVAGVVEIHEMALVDNVMRMRAVPGIDIRAGKGAELKPGGYHLMLLELKRQLKEGESIPLTLVIEGRDKKRTTIAVNAEVRPLQTPAKSAKAHEHANH